MSENAALHPRFQAALDRGDAAALVGIALRARTRADEGHYCDCPEPVVAGLDLMCGACLLNNRDQELRRLLSIYGAHDFEADASPSGLLLGWCRCTWDEANARHHGTDMPFVTTWGQRFSPPYDDLRARLTRSGSSR